jgi:hypothetical protein
MNNPNLVTPINNKIQLSNSANVPLGAGIKTFMVNPTPKAEIQTCSAVVISTGAKYVTDATSSQPALNTFTVLTNLTAKTFEVNTNTAGLVVVVNIVGVNDSNDEISENITTNGLTAVTTVNTYKFINDITLVSGVNLTTQIVFVRPSGGTPQDQRITLSGTAKNNWGFMCSNKNGRTRKARLRSINSLQLTTASSNFSLHVFSNNATTGASLGIYNTRYRMYDTGSPLQGITFADEGVLELNPGELAVWYRESGSTVITAISFTWSLYYTN